MEAATWRGARRARLARGRADRGRCAAPTSSTVARRLGPRGRPAAAPTEAASSSRDRADVTRGRRRAPSCATAAPAIGSRSARRLDRRGRPPCGGGCRCPRPSSRDRRSSSPTTRPGRRSRSAGRGRRAGRRGRARRLGRARGPAPAADDASTPAGAAVIPGFVDSHAHLVFAGDRGAEFAARMAGRPYAAGGIRTTVAATRAATDETCGPTPRRLVAEMLRAGHHHHRDQERVRPDGRGRGAVLRIAGELTDESTYLGAHVVPAEYAEPGRLRRRSSAAPMLEACAPHARWVDVFCERGAFDGDQPGRSSRPASAAGLRAPGPRQPAHAGPGRTARGRAGRGVGGPLHLSVRRGRRRARRPGHGGHTAAGRRSSRPGRRTRTPAGCSTRARPSRSRPTATRGRATRRSMPLCVALAVREMRMSPAEALWSATGAARGRCAATTSAISVSAPGRPRRARRALYVHLAYRPGVPLSRGVWQSGRRSC